MTSGKWYDEEFKNKISEAIKEFWKKRNGGQGVTSGKTMDPFVDIIKEVIALSGLKENETTVFTKDNDVTLPGYFRPHKRWDLLVFYKDSPIIVIEFKSQVGSVGNNFNNRSEEVVGSGFDLATAITEDALGDEPNIFKGYLVLVENDISTQRKPSITMRRFPVMKEFLDDQSVWGKTYIRQTDGTYPSAVGVSYLKRYDILCRRIVYKDLYDAAALLVASQNGEHHHLTAETSLETFLTRMKGHCQVVASIESQKLD